MIGIVLSNLIKTTNYELSEMTKWKYLEKKKFLFRVLPI